jgi:hypothetical protein
MGEMTIAFLSERAVRALVVLRERCSTQTGGKLYISKNGLDLLQIGPQDLADLKGEELITWGQENGWQVITIREREVLHYRFQKAEQFFHLYSIKWGQLHEIRFHTVLDEAIQHEYLLLAYEAWSAYKPMVDEIFTELLPQFGEGEDRDDSSMYARLG